MGHPAICKVLDVANTLQSLLRDRPTCRCHLDVMQSLIMQTGNDTNDVFVFAAVIHPVTTQPESSPPSPPSYHSLWFSLCILSVPKRTSSLPLLIPYQTEKRNNEPNLIKFSECRIERNMYRLFAIVLIGPEQSR